MTPTAVTIEPIATRITVTDWPMLYVYKSTQMRLLIKHLTTPAVFILKTGKKMFSITTVLLVCIFYAVARRKQCTRWLNNAYPSMHNTAKSLKGLQYLKGPHHYNSPIKPTVNNYHIAQHNLRTLSTALHWHIHTVYDTVDWEILIVKTFSWLLETTKIF